MSQRIPLTTLHNECFARRRVQRTYGKKSKASAALLGTQDFLKMTNEIETKLAGFSISEDKEREEKDIKEIQKTTELVHDKKQSSVEPKKTVEPKSRAKTKPKPKKKEKVKVKALADDVDTSSFEINTPALSRPVSDQDTIANFVKEYSDRGILDFPTYGNLIDESYNIEKIGEGTFSNVFALTHKSAAGLRAGEEVLHHQTTIIKLMPISLPSQRSIEGTTEASALAKEVQTLKVMDSVHGFIRYRGLVVTKGNWPTNFYQAFTRFGKDHPGRADNEDPTAEFDSNQHYALLEMGYAGRELEEIKSPSEFQIHDVFWSLCIHLANAESTARFEHRDMHVSNICIKPADPTKDCIDVETATVANMKQKPDVILGMTNIAITIIDYTYSRLTFPASTNANRGNNFRDFTSEYDYDEMLRKLGRVKNKADYEVCVQHLTYAKATRCIDVNHWRATQAGQNYDPNTNALMEPWEYHIPQTNVCWLGYLLAVLLHRAPKRSRHRYVAGSNEVAIELQDEMRLRLEELMACVTEKDIDQMPQSATDVVRLGVENGWLSKTEIEAFKARLEEES